MGALDITGHVIYNPAYTYKFQLKTTRVKLFEEGRTVCNRGDTILCSRLAPANKRKLGQSLNF